MTPVPAPDPAAPCVLVVMAVFRPDPGHLRAQLDSIAAQDHRPLRLVAVIADAASGALLRDTAAAAGLSDTVVVSTGAALDSVRAFETGIAEALRLVDTMTAAGGPEPLIALCDQDDIWHADRLSQAVAVLARRPAAQLVHSDARLVGPDGQTVLRPSVFAFERRHRDPGLRGLLYRNNVTGMTLTMRPRLARLSLPFPNQSGLHFHHDLWLALLAAATGGIELIRRPLVDYRQHGTNVLGAVDREGGGLRGRLRRGLPRLIPDQMWLRREAAPYALARFLAHSTYNRLVEAVADGRLPQGVARARPLRPFLSRIRGGGTHLRDALVLLGTGHAGLARIAYGFAVVSVGRVGWIVKQALGPGMNEAIDRFDTRLYSLSPGVLPRPPATGDPAEAKRRPDEWESLVDIRKEPRWTPEFSAPAPALTVLVPTLNPTEIFAGIVTALDIGLGIAARGMAVRFVATDLPVSSVAASRNFLLARLDAAATAAGAEDRITLHCSVSQDSLPAHRDDVFLVSAWWSAHSAERLIRRHGYARTRFLYLLQDFEPNFYPWGQEFADAMASYDFSFDPVFNTTLLRDYFARMGFGFATPDALAFHPAIDIGRYADPPRDPRRPGAPRRIALYGRPEVPRNMFATAIESLARFVTAEGLAPGDAEILSVGLTHPPVRLPGGVMLKSLGKLPWHDYPGWLRGVDVGLSLMYSPHPSHPPIEMAASGAHVVTNGFGPKDLGRLSPAIRSVPATPPDIAAALSEAWHAPPVSDAARRIDLRDLGLPPAEVIDRLAERLAPGLRLKEE